MKKILAIFAALAMTVMAAAQTVEHSTLFENTYVTVLGGGATSTTFNQTATPFFWDGAKQVITGVRPLAGIEVGKYITPVVGFGLEGLAFFGTTGSYTLVDQSNVLFNGKLNFSNWFGGYKGQPRVFEVVGVAGLGWGHDYGEPYIDPNYVVYNTGAEFNFNLGKERAWQITVRPGVLWNNYDNLPKFNWGTDARANVQVGVTYKFGSKEKGHNFRLCPYSVTKEEYDALKSQYDELLARKPETVVKEVPVIKKEVVTETVEVQAPNSVTVYFDLGKSVVSDRERAHLDFWAENADKNRETTIKVTGSADTKTGSLKRNEQLAEQRANAIKNILVNDYGFDADKVTTEVVLDLFENPARSRVAVVE